jgi:hypothetical protein
MSNEAAATRIGPCVRPARVATLHLSVPRNATAVFSEQQVAIDRDRA